MSGSDLAPLSGKLVVALEQAVAAPFCSSRLADAGARVIKIERKGAGDFARAYDTAANGESAYFTWLNRGKESVALDIKADEDREILLRMLENADWKADSTEFLDSPGSNQNIPAASFLTYALGARHIASSI